MKNLLLIIALFIVSTMTVQAQKIYRYIGTSREYFEKSGERICWADGTSKHGKIYISKHLIKIDWSGRQQDCQVFTIIKTSPWEIADENYHTKCFTLLGLSGKGFKTVEAVLLLNEKYQATDFILKDSDTVHTSYTIKPLFKHEIKRIGKKVVVDYN